MSIRAPQQTCSACMQKCLQPWRHLVATWLVPFAAAAVHLQAVQGKFEIHQLCLLGNGHAKTLESAISIYAVGYCRAFHRVMITVPTHIYIYIYLLKVLVSRTLVSGYGSGPWLQVRLCGEAAWHWCACWLTWLAAGSATVLDKAGRGAAGVAWCRTGQLATV